MLPHRRREFATANHFTFSNPIHKDNEDRDGSDGMEYDTWAERIKVQYNSFGKSGDIKFGAWTRRNPRNNSHEDEKEDFSWLAKAEEDGKWDTPSPELWKKAGSPTIHSAETSPARSHRDDHISHSSRAQTIAGYRREMLDLVRDMPETAYELSLRDIVESPKIVTPLQETVEETLEEENEEKKSKKKSKKKEKNRGRGVSRSESLDTGGLLLKLSIPKVPRILGGKRKSSVNSGTCAKVSPKPSGDGEKGTDREWCSAEFGQMIISSNSSGSSGSSGGSGSTGSSSSKSSSEGSKRNMRGCYPFLRTR